MDIAGNRRRSLPGRPTTGAARGAVADLVRPAHSLSWSSVSVGALALALARRGEASHAPEWAARIATRFDDARRELLAERERRASA